MLTSLGFNEIISNSLTRSSIMSTLPVFLLGTGKDNQSAEHRSGQSATNFFSGTGGNL
jgi:hypothetical protein